MNTNNEESIKTPTNAKLMLIENYKYHTNKSNTAHTANVLKLVFSDNTEFILKTLPYNIVASRFIDIATNVNISEKKEKLIHIHDNALCVITTYYLNEPLCVNKISRSPNIMIKNIDEWFIIYDLYNITFVGGKVFSFFHKTKSTNLYDNMMYIKIKK